MYALIQLKELQNWETKMIKIKSDVNSKMLENFQHQTFPDICIITDHSKLNLVSAYLSIDSAFFAGLEPDILEVNLSHLPEQALLQILRALYGDQLVVDSVTELEDMYRVISELEIDDYKTAIEKSIFQSKQLMQNLQILQFCFKNNLLLNRLKQFHFRNNLRSLQDNRNFLQLNKISLDTLIPLLVQYYSLVGEEGFSIINNIMENYFNRNNIRAAQFFQEHDVQSLQSVWQQFHHTLQIYDRKPIKAKSSDNFYHQQQSATFNNLNKRSSLNLNQRKEQQKAQLEQKNKRIAYLNQQIQSKQKIIDKLRKQLHQIRKMKGGPTVSVRRIPSIPTLPAEDQEISILEGVKNSKKQQVLKNKRSIEDTTINQQAFKNDYKEAKGHKVLGMHPKISRP